MRILLIEDTELKRLRVADFLSTSMADADVRLANSMSAGRDAIESYRPDLIILDMSLPVFDFETVESGFSHLSYGGIDILERLDQTDAAIPVIVLTAFVGFGKRENAKTLHQLDEELRREYPHIYRGHVSYSSVSDNWETELHDLINSIFQAPPPQP